MKITQKIKNLIADYRFLVVTINKTENDTISQQWYNTLDEYFTKKYNEKKANLALDIICTTNINNKQVYTFLQQL